MRPHSIRTAAFCALLSLACACSAHAESMSIGSIHCNDADGMPLTKGKPVSFTGIVTGQFSTDVNVKLYIQDATGGVNVYGTPKNCVALGDSVRVSGVVAGFRGLTEITGTDEAPLAVELLGHATLAPTPLALTIEQVLATGDKSGCEPNESRLIQLNDVRILSGHGEALPDTAIFADGTNYRLVGADTSTYVMVRVTEPTGCVAANSLVGQKIPRGAAASVVGVLSQYAGRTSGHGGYQLLPRNRFDVAAMPAKTTPVAAPAKH